VNNKKTPHFVYKFDDFQKHKHILEVDIYRFNVSQIIILFENVSEK